MATLTITNLAEIPAHDLDNLTREAEWFVKRDPSRTPSHMDELRDTLCFALAAERQRRLTTPATPAGTFTAEVDLKSVPDRSLWLCRMCFVRLAAWAEDRQAHAAAEFWRAVSMMFAAEMELRCLQRLLAGKWCSPFYVERQDKEASPAITPTTPARALCPA
jgi:hypothetical protein